MTFSLLLVALALLVLPARGRSTGGQPEGAASARLLRGVAVVGAAGGCVALLGPVPGLIGALAVCPLGWIGLRRLEQRPARERLPGGDPAVPLVLDLAAATLRAGRPPADAIAAAAPAAPDAVRLAFERVAGLLRLGADPAQAWSVLARDGPLGPVAVVAVRSAASGARLAVAFERLATELRAESATAAAARAQRAGVLSMAPLGACFLPSFVLLGVVPVIVGMARTALGGVP